MSLIARLPARFLALAAAPVGVKAPPDGPAPSWPLASRQGVGPRVAKSGLGWVAKSQYSAPHEDRRLT
jgi:hypothetical protein